MGKTTEIAIAAKTATGNIKSGFTKLRNSSTWGRRRQDDKSALVMRLVRDLAKTEFKHLETYTKMEHGAHDPKTLKEQFASLPKDAKDMVIPLQAGQDISHHRFGSIWSSNGITKAEFADDPEFLEILVRLLTWDDNPDLQLKALQIIEELVATLEDVDIKAKVVHSRRTLTALSVLLAHDDNPEFQVRSASILKYLAEGDHKTKRRLVDHPGVLHELVVSFNRDDNPPLQQTTGWALSSLASGDEHIKFKIVQKFGLKGLKTLLEDKTDPDLQLNAVSAWRNLITDTDTIKTEMVRYMYWQDLDNLTMGKQSQNAAEGEAYQGLGAFLQDLEDEVQIRQEVCVKDDDKEKDNGIPMFIKEGLHSLGPRLQGVLRPGQLFKKMKSVKIHPEPEFDFNSSDDKNPNEGPEAELPIQPLPLEVLLMSKPKDLQDKDRRQLRKALRDLCDLTQAPLPAETLSSIIKHPEALMGLVSLQANPSLRRLAGSALRSLAANDQEIKAKLICLLVSLTGYVNRLQESAIWGLGSLAAGNDGIKAEIVNFPGALESTVALLSEDTKYRLRGPAAVVLRNLAAGCSKIKATICELPGVLNLLVHSLKDNWVTPLKEKNDEAADDSYLEKMKVPTTDLVSRFQGNTALALGNLACGDDTLTIKARIVNHPGALTALVLALTKYWNPVVQQNAAFAIGNLASGDTNGKMKEIILNHPGVLVGLTLALTKDKNPILQQKAAFALSNLANGDRQMKARITDHPGALEALVDSLTKSTNPALQKNAARTLGILATGDNNLTKSKIASHPGALEGLVLASLNHDNIGMRRNLEWTSRSLANNGDEQTMAKTNIFLDLSKMFSLQGTRAGTVTPKSAFSSTFSFPPKSNFRYRLGDEDESWTEDQEWQDYMKFGYLYKIDTPSPLLNLEPKTGDHNSPPSAPQRIDTVTKAGTDHTPPASDAPNFHEKSHFLRMLLRSLPKDADAFHEGPILKRKAIRNLCDHLATPSMYQVYSALTDGEIVDHPGVLDGLGVVLTEDANPHLQRMAGLSLKILATRGSWRTKTKISDNPPTLVGLVTALTKTKNPYLQEAASTTLASLVEIGALKAEVDNHIKAMLGLVGFLTRKDHPSWRITASKVQGIFASGNDEAQVKILDYLTLLLGPVSSLASKDNLYFKQVLSNIVVRLARSGGVETVAKIVDSHPWVLKRLLDSLRSGTALYLYGNQSGAPSDDPNKRVEAASGLSNLASGGVEIKAKLVNNPRVITELVLALSNYDNCTSLHEKAAEGLTNLAAGDNETKARIVDHPGALEAIVVPLTKKIQNRKQNSALCLCYLAAGTNDTKAKIVARPSALDGLVQSMMEAERPSLRWHASLALMKLADGDGQTKTKLVNHNGVLERVLYTLKDDKNPSLQRHASRALMKLADGDTETKAKIVHHFGILDGIVKALADTTNMSLQRHASRVLVKLAQGNEETKAKILDNGGLVERLVKSLSEDKNPHLQENAALALGKMTVGEMELKKRLRETEGLMEGLLCLLDKKESPSPRKWAAVVCALTLLDPVRENETSQNARQAFCRGCANFTLGLYEEALKDLHAAEQLQQRNPLKDLDSLCQMLSRCRRKVRNEESLADFSEVVGDMFEIYIHND
ncbi:unnamed protein product [Calypogeia fissa]